MSSIELAVQHVNGRRITITADNPSWTLAQVLSSLNIDGVATVRHLQRTISKSEWPTTSLADLGLQKGTRALLLLETQQQDQDLLQLALSKILSSNFDQDSVQCLITLMKVLDNVLQKPGNTKVRSLKLSNPVVSEKIVARQGADFLVACGFVRESQSPPLLSTSTIAGDEYLVLTEAREDTSLLVRARRLLMQTAIQELHCQADDLPKYKPPPAQASASVASSTTLAGRSDSFNPYQRYRHNTTGQPHACSEYVSTTEKRLQQLKQKQDRLEAQMQASANFDRQIVAHLPNERAPSLVASSSSSNAATGPSDGSLLAQRFQRQEQERLQREEGGFTTKAMRDLERMQKARVYSHVQLRVQFTSGHGVEMQCLPKETLQTVKSLIQECLTPDCTRDFDLYVAPPRRKLDLDKTLHEEGLVPAAKVFCSWTGNGTLPDDFIRPQLFASSNNTTTLFPTATPVVADKAAASDPKQDSTAGEGASQPQSSREEEMMRRMMSGGTKPMTQKKKTATEEGNNKPKWFKGK